MDLANWVSQLAPGRTVLSTCIPASHDSASARSGDFGELLNAGVRYFAVRCERDGERIVLPRGGAGFEDVVRDQLVPWSVLHPREVLFLDLDIDDRCEEEVAEILGRHIPADHIAIEYFDPRDGSFRPGVTWGDLAQNHRRFVITWSSRRFTPNSPEQLGWSTRAEVRKQRLFADWSGLAAVPTLVDFKNALYMCLLGRDGGVYIATSDDGLAWSTKTDVLGQRLFGDWSGVRSTPTLVTFNGALYMCLLDRDGAIYVARSADGVTWPGEQEVRAQRLFGDWSGVRSTPTLVSVGGALIMCLLDSRGAIHVARSSDGSTWQSKAEVEQQRLFGDWSGVGSTPNVFIFKGAVIMALLDSAGAAYVARSSDGSTWQSKDEVVQQRLFGDWSGVSSSPTLAVFADQLFMCVMDREGGVYVTTSDDGRVWPARSELASSRLFGDWAGVRTTPTLVVPGAGWNGLIMCLGDRAGGVFVAKGSAERPSVIAWLSYSDSIRWSPCADNEEQSGDVLKNLGGRISAWKRDRMFVLQVDPPRGVLGLDAGSINVVMRDFVNDDVDVIAGIVAMNDRAR